MKFAGFEFPAPFSVDGALRNGNNRQPIRDCDLKLTLAKCRAL
jgi:hypothetical protein